MSEALQRAFDYARNFLKEVDLCEEENPSSLGRCVSHGLPTALLAMANIADKVDDAEKDDYFDVVNRIAGLDAEYVPNPGKTHPSYQIIEDHFPEFRRPAYED